MCETLIEDCSLSSSHLRASSYLRYFPSRTITTTPPPPSSSSSSSSAQKPARCALCTGAFPDRRVHAYLLTAPVFLVHAGGAGSYGGALGGGFPYLSPPIIQVPQIIPGHGSMGMRASSADTFLIIIYLPGGQRLQQSLSWALYLATPALLDWPTSPCESLADMEAVSKARVDASLIPNFEVCAGPPDAHGLPHIPELNEITAGSSTSSPPCGGSRPKWKEVFLPAHWDGSSTRELEAKRAEIDEILYGAAEEAPFSNIFLGGIGQAAGLAMHVSIFFPFELAGVIAVNPEMLLITADLLGMAKNGSIIPDIWGPTKVFGYYTPRGSHVTFEPGLHAMDIPYAGSYGGRLQWAPYDSIDVAELMWDKFSQPKCSIIFVTDDEQTPKNPDFRTSLIEELHGEKIVTSRCGFAFHYGLVPAEEIDHVKLSSPIPITDIYAHCRGLSNRVQEARNIGIPGGRIFTFGQGAGRELIDICRSEIPLQFREIPTARVASPEVKWQWNDVRAVALSTMRKVRRELQTLHRHRTVIFAYKSPQAAMRRKALESEVVRELSVNLRFPTRVISLVLPDMKPQVRPRPKPLWMGMIYRVLSFTAPVQSATLVAEIPFTEASEIGIMTELRGNFFYHVGPKQKQEISISLENLRSINYPTEKKLMTNLPKAFVEFLNPFPGIDWSDLNTHTTRQALEKLRGNDSDESD
ncbi:hypothetical protein FOZ63_001582 [Perkinsus olseni]|uniref:Uncharacterized protein n=1 Tax=Perkinsus olseni TaxID=32597 RepID=A0A7J6S9L2_PEROL|nr:hypothetical protein FOZ63_001582 [Perkinsus olseni]